VENPLLFALAVATLLITPGPTNTLLAAAGATAGFRRSLPLLLGELAGYNITIFTIGNLLGAHASESGTRTVLSLVAAAYLSFLAIRMWRVRLEKHTTTVRLRHVFVTTLLNPKALIFALLIVPVHSPNAALYFAAFSAIVAVVGGTWIGFGTFVGNIAGSRYLTFVPKVTSVALAIFATVLILLPLTN